MNKRVVLIFVLVFILLCFIGVALYVSYKTQEFEMNKDVDGEWGEYGNNWTPCSPSKCIQYSFRKCDSPPPQNDGLDCLGLPYKTRKCC